MDHLRQQIEQKIEQLASEYRNAPATILTEDDLQCLLVDRLLDVPELSLVKPTRDADVRGTMVHTEVSWFDENGRLRIKPDITILEPSNLSIFHGSDGCSLPRKGFTFDGRAVIFELKLIRGRSGVTKRSVAAIRRDLDKITRLLTKLENEGVANHVFCYFVVFSKVDRHSPELDGLASRCGANHRLAFMYKTAGVTWPKNSRTASNTELEPTAPRRR